jgi:hypothetical protein
MLNLRNTVAHLLALTLLTVSGSSFAAEDDLGSAVSILSRAESVRYDIVTVHRAESGVTEILLSLPFTKHTYSAADHASAGLAVNAVTAQLSKRLERYGATVGYSESQGLPTLTVTVLSELVDQVLPLVVAHWENASFSAKAWNQLLRKHAKEPAPLASAVVENNLMGLSVDQPISTLKHDPRRFSSKRTLLVVGGPHTEESIRVILKDKGVVLRREAHRVHASPQPQAADFFKIFDSLPACTAALESTTVAEPVALYVPMSTTAVSSESWPAIRVAIAVVGTGYDSRMNRDLRQNKGWTYGAGLPVYYLPTHTVGMARTRVKPEHAAQAAQQLVVAMKSLQVSPVSKAELQQAKRTLVENYWSNRENIVHEVRYLADFIGAGMALSDFNSYAASLSRVDTTQIQQSLGSVADSAIVVPVNGQSCWLPLSSTTPK